MFQIDSPVVVVLVVVVGVPRHAETAGGCGAQPVRQQLGVLANQARSDYKTVPPLKELQEDPATGDKVEVSYPRKIYDPAVISKYVNGILLLY